MNLVRKTVAAGGLTFGAAAALLAVGPQHASAAPNFQMPFKCGYTAVAATFPDHRPPNSVDFQRAHIYGDPVLATAAGTVTKVTHTKPGQSYGKWIEIKHGGGWTSRYAHLSVQSVHKGQKVSMGTKIGEAGKTGGADGAHVHYEQRHNGVTQKAVLNGKPVPDNGHTSFTSKNKCGGGGNPHSPAEVCGSGYSVIDHHALGKAGTVHLLYNSSSKKNCAVTLKATNLKKKTPASAHVQAKGGSKHTDSGKYRYYAGPIRAKASHTCVKWGGSLGAAKYTSSFEHCD